MFYLFFGQVLQVLLYYLTGKKPLFLLPSFILPSWRTWKPFFFVFLLHGKLNSSLYIPKRVPIILSHLYEPGRLPHPLWYIKFPLRLSSSLVSSLISATGCNASLILFSNRQVSRVFKSSLKSGFFKKEKRFCLGKTPF